MDDHFNDCQRTVTYTSEFESRATSAVKRWEEESDFERRLNEERAQDRRDNLKRQEQRNISLKARGDNHYRKTHCAQIKARKGWR